MTRKYEKKCADKNDEILLCFVSLQSIVDNRVSAIVFVGHKDMAL
jgi:hypothetical protein